MLITSLPPLRNVRTAPVSMLAPELMTMADPSLVADVSTTLARSALTSTADDLSGTLFGLSLIPWLAMLYWLKHPVVGAPPGVSFGLTYLLAFVFGSIPAAIGAGALYGVSLADSDWLHGAAEALLTITNVIVVLGFRAEDRGDDPFFSAYKLRETATFLGWFLGLSALAVAATGAGVHTQFLFGLGNLPTAVWPAEPLNALSIPTWIIHTSSLVEWLVAMGLAWRCAPPLLPPRRPAAATARHLSAVVQPASQSSLPGASLRTVYLRSPPPRRVRTHRYADLSGTPEWKGVTWGMLPLHTSGIVAVTYHLFYNAPALTWLVVLQAWPRLCSADRTLRPPPPPPPPPPSSSPLRHAPKTLATSRPNPMPPPIPLQAAMTCLGNTTLAFAMYRLAYASGWTWQAQRHPPPTPRTRPTPASPRPLYATFGPPPLLPTPSALRRFARVADGQGRHRRPPLLLQ